MENPAAAATLQAASQASHGFLSLLRKSLNAHGIHLAVIALYYAGFLTLVRLRPDMETSSFLIMALGFVAFSLPIMLIGLLFWRFYHIARFVKPEHPLPALMKDMRNFLASPQRMAHGLPMVVIMVLFMYVFVQLKSNIPVLNPFSWDETWAAADRAIHFGREPWELLQPIFGYGPITFLLNINYNAWFAVMWIVWVYFAFADQASETRTRFFLSFFLAWIVVGGIMAIWLSSAGPCFYGRLGHSPDPYAPLLAYLHEVNGWLPIWAIDVQDMLWQGYSEQSSLEGISAMPSMHNGSALLFALAGYKVSRTMGRILAVHAVLIFLGSVHLAWHYAIDSYVAWPVTLAIWAAMGPVARWWHAGAAQQGFETALAGAR
jgi:hypothetical protein